MTVSSPFGLSSDADGLRRFYIAASDSADAEEARRTIPEVLPPGWTLSDQPDRATAILAVDADVDDVIVKQAVPSLRVIGTVGPSIDASVRESQVQVVELPRLTAFSQMVVAEYAVALILTLTRNMLAIARTFTDDPWVPGRDTPTLMRQNTYVYNWTGLQGAGFLYGKVVGIVGVGTIGSSVARLLAPFGVRLLYTQRHRLDEADERELGLEWREFDDLVRESDVITLHHRLQEGPGGNEGQFGRREFAMMKPTAFLVNTARGRLIDDDALVAALRDGRIAGAGLDVFGYEPLPKESPLYSLAGNRVVLSPHIAAASESEYWNYLVIRMIDAHDRTATTAR